MEFPGFQFVPVASCPITVHRWVLHLETCALSYLFLPSGIYVHWSDSPEPCLLQAEQFQLALLLCWGVPGPSCLCGPLLNLLQDVPVPPVAGSLELHSRCSSLSTGKGSPPSACWWHYSWCSPKGCWIQGCIAGSQSTCFSPYPFLIVVWVGGFFFVCVRGLCQRYLVMHTIWTWCYTNTWILFCLPLLV